MLTPEERKNTMEELKENYKRLNEEPEKVIADIGISMDDLERVLRMDSPDPSKVWMVRKYLEDKLKEKGIEMYPFTKMADRSVNKWFRYETPWRDKKNR